MGRVADLRRDAVEIFHAGLKAVDPIEAIQRHVRLRGSRLEVQGRSYDLSAYRGVYVIGAGKAAAKMAKGIEMLLGPWLKAGVVNVKYGHDMDLATVKVRQAGHPVPDEAGVLGTQEMIEMLCQTGGQDLVVCLLSGGGSALLPCPVEGVDLKDKQRTTEILLRSGATIHEMNAIRKHLSESKGGRMARLASPSDLVALILSDVVGDALESIASGPTAPDRSTFDDCIDILEKYGLHNEIPHAVRALLEQGRRGEIAETPKPGDPIFERVHNVIVGSNILALNAACGRAEELGYHGMVLSSSMEGETREVAKVHAAVAREIRSTEQPLRKPACIISGGETTVTVRGKGLGGRNQEFALALAMAISGLEGVVILSGGTDGTDGPTEAAGAIADGLTVERAREKGMAAERYLLANDSYHFFEPLGDLLVTGPTFTNVMDLRLVLVA